MACYVVPAVALCSVDLAFVSLVDLSLRQLLSRASVLQLLLLEPTVILEIISVVIISEDVH